jgi:ATP-dependent helicase/nuclease subunit B
LFSAQDTPHVFGTQSNQSFPEALLAGLTKKLEGCPPEDWAQVLIYVNTRRMQRRLYQLFLDGPARLLPTIRLITDIATDPSLTDLPMPVPTLKRRLEITQLVRELLDRVHDLAPRSAVFDLANSLATLMDEMQGEGIEPKALQNLDISDVSGHWERALQFINIVQGYFKDGTIPDTETRQRACVLALAKGWKASPPNYPIIMAGSTGSRGTTFQLMLAIAGLPQGAIVLPGFDFDMPSNVWDKLSDPNTGEDHPQFRFSRILNSLEIQANQVEPWTGDATTSSARNKLISLAMRPAPATHHWQKEGPNLKNLDEATSEITWLEAPDQRIEAMAISLRLRKAAETGETAAVITPDRNLTRRISSILAAWNITPDDSAGVPLSLTAPGRFWFHILELAQPQITPESLLILLKHPLAHSGSNRGQHLLNTRELEIYLRRKGPAFLSSRSLLKWAKSKDLYLPWANWLISCVFSHWPTGSQSMESWLSHHCTIAKQLSDGPSEKDGKLWEHAPGRDTKKIIDELLLHGPAAGTIDLPDYCSILRGILGTSETRDQNITHSNILIWGTLEARVQSADLVILAGLNDGVWPEPPTPDPWLNRNLRLQAGLLLPERKIGLSAHDFQQAIGAKSVWVTRALRSDDAETVPSRWLNRIANLLSGLDKQGGGNWLQDMRQRGAAWLELVEQVEVAPSIDPTPRPSMAPPIHTRPIQLAITDIKHLIRDPYAIYAKHILGLKRLDPLKKSPTAPLRGTVIHDILEAFIKAGPWRTAEQAKIKLLELSQTMLQDLVPWPTARRMWQARVARFADWFAEGEILRQADLLSSHTEVWGRATVTDTGFTLVGKADRVDVLHNGTARIYDYKTGPLPSNAQQLHFDKQLLLEAEILRRGGFEGLNVLQVAEATYIGVGNETKLAKAPLGEDDVWVKFSALIKSYQNPDQGYTARRAMLMVDEPSDYDQLARYGEWGTNEHPLLIKT